MTHPSIITANLLRSGEVVYLGNDGRWTTELSDARIADTPAARSEIEAVAAEAAAANEIVSAYLMDVRIEAGTPAPASMRETIRAQHRPTV
ncbi:MAG: DUF2849 domain-containing protein [Hyphomicrobiaceae bacterium]|nr:DUF2849 domain-containing protein [Hyphomicrobiaceae bacterium]